MVLCYSSPRTLIHPWNLGPDLLGEGDAVAHRMEELSGKEALWRRWAEAGGWQAEGVEIWPWVLNQALLYSEGHSNVIPGPCQVCGIPKELPFWAHDCGRTPLDVPKHATWWTIHQESKEKQRNKSFSIPPAVAHHHRLLLVLNIMLIVKEACEKCLKSPVGFKEPQVSLTLWNCKLITAAEPFWSLGSIPRTTMKFLLIIPLFALF